MSWQLASFGLVGLALAASAWWYERSRPPLMLVAVVATLAALGALGRDALAAIPDVKPTTAIVLVSGVAFGAGPGFTVGAVSALASNVLLGEGPWTPWQMLGWGAVGLLGGAIGAVAGRRIPTLLLALACALGAEIFNLIVDLYTWTGTGSHTLAAFGLVLGSAAAFDITHVLASLAFGFAFGGILLRMLLRARARMHVSWVADEPPPQSTSATSQNAAASVLALAVLALAVPALLGVGASSARGAASSAPHSYVQRALAYLSSAQERDGGFGAAPGLASSELYTAWGAIGLAAGGREVGALRRDGHSPLDALRSEAGSLEGAGDLERTILALHAAGAPVNELPGGDPVSRLLRLRGHDGSFEQLVNATAFAVLALRAAGIGTSASAIRAAGAWLERQQEGDGGFGFAPRSGSDVDDTGAVLQALAAAGLASGSRVARAVSYLRAAQNRDGGLPEQRGERSNAQSTAWAIQGLDAVGADPARMTRDGSPSPLAYLQGLMSSDGSVRYARANNQTPVWVTAEALPALAGRPLPVSAPSALAGSARGGAQHGRTGGSPRTGGAPGRAGATRPGQRLARGGNAVLAARDVGSLLGMLLASVMGR